MNPDIVEALSVLETLPWEWKLTWLFAIGLCAGSFLNVCIFRLPLGESVVVPRSRCGRCRTRIGAWDNIPILSYLLLRGRCRYCHVPFSLQYPAIELLSGLLFVSLAVHYQSARQAILLYPFVMILLASSLIDLRYRIIPDELSLGGTALGFFIAIFRTDISIGEVLLGALLGGGLLYGLALFYRLLRGYEGLGGGDVKLMALIGAFLGVTNLLFVLLIASTLGAISGLVGILGFRRGLRYAIPFGPYLSIGALTTLYFEEPLMAWLFR